MLTEGQALLLLAEEAEKRVGHKERVELAAATILLTFDGQEWTVGTFTGRDLLTASGESIGLALRELVVKAGL